MDVDLVAVQAQVKLEYFSTAEAFRAWVLGLAEEAVAGLTEGPRVVAFPETLGLPLLFGLEASAGPRRPATTYEALWDLARREWRELARQVVLRPGAGALLRVRAGAAFRVYRDAFAEAARLAGATVVAGTIFVPGIDEEPVRGLYLTDPAVRNSAFVFSPAGSILGRTDKVRLNPGRERRSGLAGGRLQDLHPVESPAGRVGVAICLDGFHREVVDTLDGRGTEILVQPSANHAPWGRPWPRRSGLSEGEAWLSYGAGALVQDRINIRVVVNPMLVGGILELEAEGRSSIVANRRYWPGAGLEGWEGVLAMASTPDSQEIVRARVALPDRPAGRP